MINLQDFIGNSELFKKFKVDDLLFAEFKCPHDESKTHVWWHNNFFAYVLAGETVMKTPQGEYNIKSGDCVFAKKGSIITYGDSHDEFCELLVFVPDSFIRSVIQKHKIPLVAERVGKQSDTILPLSADNVLLSYFHSLLSYFPLPSPPSATLLRLKFEELIVNILSAGNHLPLRCYFNEVCLCSKPSIKEIMEANFFCNLSLDEFARLCARSLSTFKTEFQTVFQTTPGKWLQEKRLEYSRYLLETTNDSVDEICNLSGFENRSHFIRVFKNRYGFTPGKFSRSQPHNKVPA